MAPVVANMPAMLSIVQESPRWFSVIDLANCFFAIPLHLESWNRFAFTFKGKQYTFTWVPQGFHNAPAIAHHHIVTMLQNLAGPDQERVVFYVDDILVWGDHEH